MLGMDVAVLKFVYFVVLFAKTNDCALCFWFGKLYKSPAFLLPYFPVLRPLIPPNLFDCELIKLALALFTMFEVRLIDFFSLTAVCSFRDAS